MLTRIPFSVRPALLFVFVLATYFFATDVVRRGEAQIVASIGSKVSGRILGIGESTTVLIHTNDGLLATDIARGCSSAVAISVILGVAVLFTTGSGTNRLRASARAVAFVFVANLFRLFFVLLAGAFGGRNALALSHDLVGTTIAYIALAFGLALLIHDSVRQSLIRKLLGSHHAAEVPR